MLTSCTFDDNMSPSGGVVRAAADSHPVFDRCILAFSEDGAAATCASGADVTLTCCDVFGNDGGDYVGCLEGQDGANGNISADPLFCGPGDRTIDWSSPCAPPNSGGCGLIGALPPACGALPDQDIVGLYADPWAISDAAWVDPYSQLHLYLVLNRPSSYDDIQAWECGLPVPDDILLMGVELPDGAFNIGLPPNYVVYLPEPLPWAEHVVLAELNYLVLGDGDEAREFYLTAADPSSTEPPQPCYVTEDGGYQYVPMIPSSGSVDDPVFFLNDPDHPPTGIVDDLPRVCSLANCRPNPFNPRTTIGYALSDRRVVRLSVFDVRGRLVNRLVNEEQPAGRHEAVWDGRDGAGRGVASGTYFYRLEAGDFRRTRAMTLVQ